MVIPEVVDDLVIYLVKNPERADALLERLNAMARDYEYYEYGLPINDDSEQAMMREAIYKWLSEIYEEK